MTDPQVIDLQLPTIGLKALAWGDPDAPLALCLHGFPDTPYTWRHLGPQLAAGAGSAASGPNNSGGWYVVAPFTRGYYPSDIPADGRYGLDALMQDAIDIHTVLGADDRAVLIGHDWGAVTSNSLARSDRSPFARVVSIAVAPLEVFEAKRPPLKAVGLLGRQLTMSWYMLFHQLSALPERLLPQLVELYWRRWSPGLDATEDLQYVADAMFRPENRHAAIGYYPRPVEHGQGDAAAEDRRYRHPVHPRSHRRLYDRAVERLVAADGACAHRDRRGRRAFRPARAACRGLSADQRLHRVIVSPASAPADSTSSMSVTSAASFRPLPGKV